MRARETQPFPETHLPSFPSQHEAEGEQSLEPAGHHCQTSQSLEPQHPSRQLEWLRWQLRTSL